MNVFSLTVTAKVLAVPETWLRCYNGPHAGLIDVETARREMPWLVGAASLLNVSSVQTEGAAHAHEARQQPPVSPAGS
jgi:hypothetical protein